MLCIAPVIGDVYSAEKWKRRDDSKIIELNDFYLGFVLQTPPPPSTLKLMMDGDENTYPFWMGVSTHFNDVLWIKNSKSYTHYTQRSYACSLKLSYSFKPSLRRWRDFFNDYLFVWCWFSMMILNGQKQNHNDANHAPQHKGSHWQYFCLPYSLYIFQKGTILRSTRKSLLFWMILDVVQHKQCRYEFGVFLALPSGRCSFSEKKIERAFNMVRIDP